MYKVSGKNNTNEDVKDKTLSAAAEQAFKGLLTIGKYGFLVLNVEIEPKKIDVNVHPTKLEIRWSEEQKVFKALYHAIRAGLLKEDLIKSSEKQEEQINTGVNNINTDFNKEENTDVQKEDKIEENQNDNEKFKTQTIKMPSFINIFKKKDNEDEEQVEK